MSRPSKRGDILDGAVRVAEEHGIGGVSIDSVAAEAGVTKQGLLYHFPSRQELLLGLYDRIAQEWEAELVDALEVPLEQATAADRLRAYVAVSIPPMRRAELAYLADAGAHPELFSPWAQVVARWAPATPVPGADGELDDAEVRLLLARVAADGLWSQEALTGISLPAELRERLAAEIVALLPD